MTHEDLQQGLDDLIRNVLVSYGKRTLKNMLEHSFKQSLVTQSGLTLFEAAEEEVVDANTRGYHEGIEDGKQEYFDEIRKAFRLYGKNFSEEEQDAIKKFMQRYVGDRIE